MSLITCPACSKQVSGAAVTCPHCAHPMQGLANVVTERTSKSIKKRQLFALSMFLGGMLVVYVSSTTESHGFALLGCLLSFIGLCWSIVLRVKRWWHHS